MNEEKKSVSVKIKVTGRVQRVGYRYFVQHWAEDFGIGAVSYTHLTLPTNREV